MSSKEGSTSWQLGRWRVEPALNRLQDGAQQRLLEPRVMTALQCLLDAQAAVVTDAQMLTAVWGGQIVSDASLYKVIGELRKALGDSEKPYRFIERVSGKGYRLLPTAIALPETQAETQTETQVEAPLEVQAAPRTQATIKTPVFAPGTVAPAPAQHRGLRRPHWLAMTAVVVVLTALGIYLLRPSGALTTTTPSSTQNPVPGHTKPVAPQKPAALQKPAELRQALWDDYWQARWLAARHNASDMSQAIALLQKVLTSAPTFASAEVELCNSYHLQHIYGDWPLRKVQALCEPLLRHALQTDAGSAAALATFGSLKLTQGDINAAAHYLDQSLSLAPDEPMSLMWRASVYRAQGALPQALSLIERAARHDPLSAMIKRQHAFTLIVSGNVGPARQVFQEALLLEPDYSDRAIDELDMLPLNVLRARAFLQWAERFPDRIFDAANPAPAINLALIQMSVGALAQADQSLQLAEQKFAGHQFVLLARAMWQDAKGNSAAAHTLLQQRAALQPNNPMYAVIALMYAGGENPERLRPKFLQMFPEFDRDPHTAVRTHLDHGQGILVMCWLSLMPKNDRVTYRETIDAWRAQQTGADTLSLNLMLLLAQTEAANTLALKLLEHGWLPSPNDDFYLAERNPLWHALRPEVFAGIKANRQQAQPR